MVLTVLIGKVIVSIFIHQWNTKDLRKATKINTLMKEWISTNEK